MKFVVLQANIALTFFLTLALENVLLANGISDRLFKTILKNSYNEVKPYQVITFMSDSFRLKNTTVIRNYPTALSLNAEEVLRSEALQKHILHKSLIIFFATKWNEAQATN